MYNIGIIGAGKVARGLIPSLVNDYPELCDTVYLNNRSRSGAEVIKKELMVEDHKFKISSLNEIVEKADIVIITAGRHYPNRANCFGVNKFIMEDLGEVFFRRDEKLYIIVSNPTDENGCVFHKKAELPGSRVLGFNHLDWSRLRYLVYEAVPSENNLESITGYVVGPHNPMMVPVFSKIKINGRGFYEIGFSEEQKESLNKELVQYAPNQIHMGGSSTRISTSRGLIEVLSAICKNKGNVCMSRLFPKGGDFNRLNKSLFLGWPVRFEGLDAIPISNPIELLDNEEFPKFVKSGEETIRFLERYGY